MDTGSMSIPDFAKKPVVKDSWKARMAERLVWTLFCAVLAKGGIVVADGFVHEAKKAEETEVQLDTERNMFGRYISTRLQKDKELEPILLRCLAEHETESSTPEGVYQP